MNFAIKKKGGSILSIKKLLEDSKSAGIILILCTIFSLVVSNLGAIGEMYNSFWELEIPFFQDLRLPNTVSFFINDALMAVFFFQMGLEIKREIVIGDLSSGRRMAFPAIAALCGVIMPAIIFKTITHGSIYSGGWAIPTATDIAFSLGILSLLGKRVPVFLKIFLTALAILDDLCAILIIAFFYGSMPDISWLLGVAICAGVIYLIDKYIKNRISTYLELIVGIAMWYCMYNSGIHATFAGVILALLTSTKRIRFLEGKLHYPVAFAIIPIFALANTSIIISPDAFQHMTSVLSFAVILGLFIGKPVGIMIASLLMSKARLIRLPEGVDWVQFLGIGFLAGVGFTMSIFISTLSFEDRAIQDCAKVSVLIGSVLSMIVGYLILYKYSQIKERQAANSGEKDIEEEVVIEE